MTVKIRKKEAFAGQVLWMTQYIPEDILLTKERKNKAMALDEELKIFCEKINDEYEILNNSIKKDELKKWEWLGQKIEWILKNTKNLDKIDIDNNAIWPGIGQYLRQEIMRGFDTKRSGTNKDHLRKCWLLAISPGLDWINSWIGWDAFADRGEQLINVMPALNKKFLALRSNLKAKDYQNIAKLLTEKIPSGTKIPKNVATMNNEKLDTIVNSVFEEFNKEK